MPTTTKIWRAGGAWAWRVATDADDESAWREGVRSSRADAEDDARAAKAALKKRMSYEFVFQIGGVQLLKSSGDPPYWRVEILDYEDDDSLEAFEPWRFAFGSNDFHRAWTAFAKGVDGKLRHVR